MSDGSELPNLLHLADDLLDPDLDLDTGDIPSDLEETPDEAPLDKTAPPLGSVGDYEFVSRFEGSDMTDVFLAHKISKFGFVRRAVVKRAKPGSEMYEVSREMLLDEAKALAWLDHPNIVSILDFGEDKGGFFLAMEHVDGTDLRYVNMSLRKRREALPLEIACFLAVEILRGLHHAHIALDPDGHALDILHRDVNPTNVLISTSGHVKLTDFGVVRMRDRLQEKTQPGIVKGKFSYMAREYILGRKCDCRVDIYAVGIMLFEMLTGRACFSKLSVHEFMKRVVEHDLPLHRMEAQNIPAHLCQIVEKATAKEPSDRFKSANAMANELETWLMRSGGHASPWIVSAFFDQHRLFRQRADSVAVKFDSAPQEVVPEPESLKEIDDCQEKTSELLVDIVSEPDIDEFPGPEEVAAVPSIGEIIGAGENDQSLEPTESPLLAAPEHIVNADENSAGNTIRLEPVGEAEIPELDEEDLVEVSRHQSVDPTCEWKGTIQDVSVAEVMEILIRKSATGEVCFENHALKKRIYVREGQCISVKTNVGMEDLAELLILQKVINRNELDRMMLGRAVSDPELGMRLVDKKKLTRERFAKIHGQQIQSCLEDVLTWRAGEFLYTPQSVAAPNVIPNLHIELILLPHLSERMRQTARKTSGAKPSKRPKAARTGGSLAEALDIARKVTGNRAKAHSDRINSDDE